MSERKASGMGEQAKFHRLDSKLSSIISAVKESKWGLTPLRFYAFGLIEGNRGSLKPRYTRQLLHKAFRRLGTDQSIEMEMMLESGCGTPVANLASDWERIEDLIPLVKKHTKKWAEWQMAKGHSVSFKEGGEHAYVMAKTGNVMYFDADEDVKNGAELHVFRGWDDEIREEQEFRVKSRLDTYQI